MMKTNRILPRSKVEEHTPTAAPGTITQDAPRMLAARLGTQIYVSRAALRPSAPAPFTVFMPPALSIVLLDDRSDDAG
ncbi:MAG: hypothetical protein ACTHJ3_17535, partial [Pararhizobium sp.]